MSIPDFSTSFREAIFPAGDEPANTFNFVVCLGTRSLGDFQEVTGIKYDMPVEEVYEGGRNHSPHLLAFGGKGAGKWGQVTLKWMTPVWSVLNDWMNAVQVGHFFRRDVFILQLNRKGWPVRIMRLHKAWPVSWKGQDLSTSSSKPTLEELTLTFESFNMVLTRTGDMPTLDDLASTAGALANFGANSANDLAGDALGLIGDIEDLFDGDAYDEMDEAFMEGLDSDGIETEDLELIAGGAGRAINATEDAVTRFGSAVANARPDGSSMSRLEDLSLIGSLDDDDDDDSPFDDSDFDWSF